MTPRRIVDALAGSGHWRLVSHFNPDGDTLGCCSALFSVGLALGKTVEWCGQSAVPARYAFLPHALEYHQANRLPDDGALNVFIDVSCADRGLPGRVDVNVDHHPDNGNFAGLNWVDPTASAAAELVWQIVKELIHPVPQEAAQALLTALVTDTGNFRFSSVTARTLSVGSELIASGAQPGWVDLQLNGQDRLEKLHLWGRCMSRAETLGNHCVLSWLDARDFAETGASEDETDELVNQLTRLKNADLVVLAYEQRDTVRCSVRSRGDWSAREFAGRWGGGGHHNAAGCRLPLPFDGALQKLKEALDDAERSAGRP